MNPKIFLLAILLLVSGIAFAQKPTDVMERCIQNPAECDCSPITDASQRAACEAALKLGQEGNAAMKNYAAQCEQNPDGCDCTTLENQYSRIQCQQAKDKAIKEAEQLTAEMKARCMKEPLKCDCTAIKTAAGREQCGAEYKVQQAKAEELARKMVGDCVDKPDACDCTLIENPAMRKFCEGQLSAGKACMEEGTAEACDQLDATGYMPAGMPSFLRGIFETSVKEKMEKERSARLSEVYDVINGCIDSLETCDCSKIKYASGRKICEAQKTLASKCIGGDAKACGELDSTPIVSANVPSFIRPFLEKQIGSLVSAKKAKIASEMGPIVTDCVKDPKTCDCSKLGYGKGICEERKALTIKCEDGDIDVCTQLESNMIPEGVPAFIRGPLEKLLSPLIESKKKGMAMSMIQDMGPKLAACFQNPNTCDCSPVPKAYRDFCEERKGLGIKCMGGDFEACKTLDSLPIMPENVPEFVRAPLEKILRSNIANVKATAQSQAKAMAEAQVAKMKAEAEAKGATEAAVAKAKADAEGARMMAEARAKAEAMAKAQQTG